MTYDFIAECYDFDFVGAPLIPADAPKPVIVQDWIKSLSESEKKQLAERAMSVTRSLCGG